MAHAAAHKVAANEKLLEVKEIITADVCKRPDRTEAGAEGEGGGWRVAQIALRQGWRVVAVRESDEGER